MKSLKKISILANKFENKLRKRAIEMGEAAGPVVLDAFFGPPSPGFGQQEFMNHINKADSHFNQVAGNVKGSIKIDVRIDAPSGKANFVVSTNSPNASKALSKALEKDYYTMYKELPSQQLSRRLKTNQIRPPTASGVANLTVM